jgi:hypothetical protein
MGHVGADGTEVQSLTVYNGKLYGGSVPFAEVCRNDGKFQWTSLRRFYAPAGWQPGPPGKMSKKDVNEASRVTSMTVFNGKLFASIGSSTSSILDGKVASYDDDFGPGWKHLVAMRDGGQLKLFVNGKFVSTSTSFDPAKYDVSTNQPLRIGFGQTEYFAGKMTDVRLYKGALDDQHIQELCSIKPN